MTDITRILSQIEDGDPNAAEQLLPLVYEQLRNLAAAKLAREQPGQTLQATALVHEAYLRLVGNEKAQSWDSRGHFFAAAAQAMRHILVEAARKKKSQKRGGGWERVSLDHAGPLAEVDVDNLLLLDDELRTLSQEDALGARLVELRYFAGLSVEQAAATIGVSPASAYRHWAFARAWLHSRVGRSEKK